MARLPAATRRLLLRLSRSPRVRLAFVSGRALRDLAGRARIRGAHYSGNHGLEIRGPRLDWRHPKAVEAAPDIHRLAKALSGVERAFPGAAVEDKTLTLAVHYRRVQAGRVRALRATVRRAAAPYLGALALRDGKKTLELRPRAAWDKGRALLKIARALGAGRRVAFIGDDRTDEDAFRLLGARALTVKVGPGRTRARFRVGRQQDVRRILELLCREAG